MEEKCNNVNIVIITIILTWMLILFTNPSLNSPAKKDKPKEKLQNVNLVVDDSGGVVYFTAPDGYYFTIYNGEVILKKE